MQTWLEAWSSHLAQSLGILKCSQPRALASCNTLEAGFRVLGKWWVGRVQNTDHRSRR